MRVLAFADTQIGVSTVDLADQRAVLDQIVQVALEEEVNVVLHGGDVFEGPVVTPEHLKCFVDAMKPLYQKMIPLIVLRGNGRHDLATREVNALNILSELGIIVCDRPQVVDIPKLDLSICALPWVQPGHLLARLDGGIDRDRVNAQMSALLVQIAQDIRPEHGMSILLAHWAITGSALPSGLAVEEIHEPILPWADLDAIGYDLVIGAHIHQPQIISNPEIDQGPCVVLGSPQQLNFGEHGERGCWIFNVADTGVWPEFVPIKSRQFVTLEFDHADPVAQIALSKSVGWAEQDGAIVRVRYTETEEQAQRIDTAALTRDLMAAGAKRVKIEPQIMRKERARVESINEQLTQVEALVKWCEANEVGPEMQQRMVGRLQEWT